MREFFLCAGCGSRSESHTRHDVQLTAHETAALAYRKQDESHPKREANPPFALEPLGGQLG